MSNEFALEERRTALARVLHQLHKALELVQAAQYTNHTHALGLDLPLERPITEAIHHVVQTYQKPTGVTQP